MRRCIWRDKVAYVIDHSYLAMLLYEVDSTHLTSEQVKKTSVAYNNYVRCFGSARLVSVRNMLYFLRNLPVKQILQMRRVLWIKDFLNYDGILRILSLISSNSNDFVDLCYMYDVHCGMTIDRINKCNIETANNLRVEGLIKISQAITLTYTCIAALWNAK